MDASNHPSLGASPLKNVLPRTLVVRQQPERQEASGSIPPPRMELHNWHPKLTPYRLTVITTTIGLGTFKSIAASSPIEPSSSVTAEWILGVVLFLL